MTRGATPGLLPLVLLLAAAMLLNYVDRGTVSTAAPLMTRDLALSATQFGIAVSAFFWVYAPAQALIGWLCDRLSVYRLLAAGMALCAVSTALTGLVGGLASLVLLRMLLGLGESVAFPACSKIIARHVPDSRRGTANAVVAAALAVGPGLGTLAGGLIMAVFGWRAMFIALAIATLAWLLPWHIATRGMGSKAAGPQARPFPMLRLLRERALWAMSIGHFVGNLTLYFVMTWLPLYTVKVHNMSIPRMTVMITAVYVAQAASALVIGWWSDRLVARGLHEGIVRKTFVAIGLGGVGAAALAIPHAASPAALAGAFLAIGLFQGFNGGNIFALAQIYAGPNAAGTWVGLQNTISNMAGIVGPVIIGLIIDRAGGFGNAFLFAAATAFFGGLWFLLALRRPEPIDQHIM